jgi:hypothetical protein
MGDFVRFEVVLKDPLLTAIALVALRLIDLLGFVDAS